MKTKYFLLDKSAIILMLFLFFLLTANLSIIAQGNNEKTVNQVINDIRKELNLGTNDNIDPDKVPDNLLEDLGVAVIREIHPSEREIRWMNDMMGGDGTASLKAMYRIMGYRYLEGDFNYTGINKSNNFWRRGFGNNMMWPNYMMGRRYYNNSPWNIRNWFFNNRWIGGISMFILWLVILGFISYFIYLAATKNAKSKVDEDSALEILKRRYASGEITKKEFEDKKKDIL